MTRMTNESIYHNIDHEGVDLYRILLNFLARLIIWNKIKVTRVLSTVMLHVSMLN